MIYSIIHLCHEWVMNTYFILRYCFTNCVAPIVLVLAGARAFVWLLCHSGGFFSFSTSMPFSTTTLQDIPGRHIWFKISWMILAFSPCLSVTSHSCSYKQTNKPAPNVSHCSIAGYIHAQWFQNFLPISQWEELHQLEYSANARFQLPLVFQSPLTSKVT